MSITQIADELNEFFSQTRKSAMEEFTRNQKGEQFILHYLYKNKRPMLPSEISTAMRSSSARVSAALNTLEKKGLILREIDPANRRNILVSLTDDGAEYIQALVAKRNQQLLEILTAMGEEDAAEYVRLTKKLFEISQTIFAKHQKE